MYKNLNFFVIVNWKMGTARVVKKYRGISYLGTFEIPLKLDLNFLLPEETENVLSSDIIIPKAQVTKAMLEKLENSE